MNSKDSPLNINVIDEDVYAEELYKDLISSCSKHVKVKDINRLKIYINSGILIIKTVIK